MLSKKNMLCDIPALVPRARLIGLYEHQLGRWTIQERLRERLYWNWMNKLWNSVHFRANKYIYAGTALIYGEIGNIIFSKLIFVVFKGQFVSFIVNYIIISTVSHLNSYLSCSVHRVIFEKLIISLNSIISSHFN